MTTSRLRSCAALAALPLLCLSFVGSARAATISVVTPGEQNTASSEFECKTMPCAGGKWFYYPELLQVALGNGYTVHNNGDGGAVLGCGPMSATLAGTDSFCKSPTYTASLTPPPGIAIIGPFGEHDQRIVVKPGNQATLYTAAMFEDAYEGIVQDYLKVGAKVYMMTPIDMAWNSGALPAGDDIVKDLMLPASKKIAMAHQLVIIDTYAAMSSSPALVTMYNGSDGQVNTAGQQKMAELIEAALASGSGGAGGAGAGGAAGTGGASVAGAGGAAGASTGAGGTGGDSTGGAPSAGAPGGAGAPSAAGAASVAGAPSTGAGGAPSGTAGASTVTEPSGSSDSGGCTIAAVGKSGWSAGLLLAMAGALGLARRRRQRTRG
jgi:hypothetical protein